jgi:hypothetical protein
VKLSGNVKPNVKLIGNVKSNGTQALQPERVPEAV